MIAEISPDLFLYGGGVVKVGDQVMKDDAVLEVHARTQEEANAALERLTAAMMWSTDPVTPPPLFYDVITSE